MDQILQAYGLPEENDTLQKHENKGLIIRWWLITEGLQGNMLAVFFFNS